MEANSAGRAPCANRTSFPEFSPLSPYVMGVSLLRKARWVLCAQLQHVGCPGTCATAVCARAHEWLAGAGKRLPCFYGLHGSVALLHSGLRTHARARRSRSAKQLSSWWPCPRILRVKMPRCPRICPARILLSGNLPPACSRLEENSGGRGRIRERTFGLTRSRARAPRARRARARPSTAGRSSVASSRALLRPAVGSAAVGCGEHGRPWWLEHSAAKIVERVQPGQSCACGARRTISWRRS